MMSRRSSWVLTALCLAACCAFVTVAGAADKPVPPRVELAPRVLPGEANRWGLTFSLDGKPVAIQAHPVQLEFWSAAGALPPRSSSYESLEPQPSGFVARATVPGPGRARFEFVDRWEKLGEILLLKRTVTVHGSAGSAFLSAITLELARPASWPELDWFAPGMIYGSFDHLNPHAIGGRAHYRAGDFTVRIREDRLPAPLLQCHTRDGLSLAVLDCQPRGGTTPADARDVDALTLVDPAFRFGAIGAQERGRTIELGYWFPGSEGEVTYAGNTYPGGQMHRWRRRYHPIHDGLVQQYEIAFRIGAEPGFPAAMKAAWRWSWRALRPAVVEHDLAAARRSLANALSSVVVSVHGRTGIPNFIEATTQDVERADRRAVLGFTGKNLEAAQVLLREAKLDGGPRGQMLRSQAESIIDTFLKLQVSPPGGEGFDLDTGQAVSALGGDEVYLRSFGDDVKSLLAAYFYCISTFVVGSSKGVRVCVSNAGRIGRARCVPTNVWCTGRASRGC